MQVVYLLLEVLFAAAIAVGVFLTAGAGIGLIATGVLGLGLVAVAQIPSRPGTDGGD